MGYGMDTASPDSSAALQSLNPNHSTQSSPYRTERIALSTNNPDLIETSASKIERAASLSLTAQILEIISRLRGVAA